MLLLMILIISQNVRSWMGNPIPYNVTSYNYDVYPVSECPENASQWNLASERLNCTTDNTQKHRYHCMPDRGKRTLLEFCYPRVRFLMIPGFCIVLFNNGYMSKSQDTNCSVFTNNSCPDETYYSDSMYKYPACSLINPQHQCYKFDPSCPPEDQTVEPSFSRESTVSSITIPITNPNLETITANGNSTYKIALTVAVVLISAVITCGLICRWKRQKILQIWNRFRGLRDDENQGENEVLMNTGEQAKESYIQNDFLNEWQLDDVFFYDGIGAVQELEERLLKKSIIMVVGGPGLGKTSLVRHIALKWHTQKREETGKELKSWKIFVISSFEELNNIYSANEESKDLQIYIFDDPIGIHALSEGKLSSLFDLCYKKNLFATKQTTKKLLMTCRRMIYEEAKENMPKIKNFIMDIESERNKFTENSKEKIFKKHCGEVDFSPIRFCPDTLYPLLCRLYAKRKNQNIFDFFTKPFECLQLEFENMKHQDPEMYFSLVFCMLNKGEIPTKENNTNETCPLGTEVIEKYLGYDFLMDDIQGKLKNATGTYIKISESNFVFIHDYMSESLAIHFGNTFPEPILEHMSTSFILKFFKIDDAKDSHHACIVVQPNSHEKYISMLAKRVFDKDIHQLHLSIFTHSCWQSPSFQQEFLATLDGVKYTDICKIFFDTRDSVGSVENSQDFTNATCLESGTTEWHRNELLWNKIYKMEFDYSYDIRPLRWIVANALTFLLQYLISVVTRNNENASTIFGEDEEQRLLLVLACFSRDREIVETVFTNINNKENINHSCISGSDEKEYMYNPHRKFTPLAAACHSNSPSVVQYLIDQKVVVFFSEDTIKTSLLYRSMCLKKKEVCLLLIDGGAKIKFKDEDANLKSEDEGANLKSEDGDANLKDKNPRTLLHISASKGEAFLSILEKLLQKGLDINEKDKDGKSPIFYAFENELKESVDDDLKCYKTTRLLLEKGAKPDLWDSQCRCPLFTSNCMHKCTYILLELVKYGLDVNFRNENGASLLHYAVLSRDGKLVECLLQASNPASINLKDKTGRSALYKATEKGYIDIVELLIEHGAEVNLTDNKKLTPLYQAVDRKFINLVQILVENGALANEKYEKKRNATPLHIAAKKGHIDISKYLLQEGADPSLKDNRNKSAIDVAADEGDYVLKNLLKSFE